MKRSRRTDGVTAHGNTQVFDGDGDGDADGDGDGSWKHSLTMREKLDTFVKAK